MDLHTAYKIMDIPEDCSLEDLEQQYYVFTEKRISMEELEKIQEAYNIIKSHMNEVNPPPKDPFSERVKEFFYHHKVHLIFGIIGAVMVGMIGYSIITGQIEKAKEANRPPAELDIMVFGNYPDDELTQLEERILGIFPTWERVDVEVIYSPIELNSEFDIGAIQKSRIELATKAPDLYIFDVYHLELFMEDGVFYPLDGFNDESHTEDRWHMFKLTEDEEEHIYGIDITDVDLFEGLTIEPFEKVAVMRADAKNEENTLTFLHTILQN